MLVHSVCVSVFVCVCVCVCVLAYMRKFSIEELNNYFVCHCSSYDVRKRWFGRADM